jgi:hypothetical protein
VSGRDDVELNGRGNRGVQSNHNGVCSHRLDRVGHLDSALVDRRAAGLFDGGDNVPTASRAEQTSGFARADEQRHRCGLQPGPDLTCRVQVSDFTDRPGAPDRVELLLATASPPDC